jgi:oligoendopeptidase F
MPTRQFVPIMLDVSSADEVVAQYQTLLERPIGSARELAQWLEDCSELSSILDEYGSRRYIDKSCHTDDAQIEARYMQFIEEIEPKIKPLFFAIQKRYLADPHQLELKGKRYEILKKRWGAEVAIFREENVPLETEVTRINAAYDKICGAMMVEFEGASYTMQQMAKFQERLDRPIRERAWNAAAYRRFADAPMIEPLFEQLLHLRKKIAANAGLDNYRSFIWLAYKRFDYTPEQCLGFAAAIEQAVVPLVKELDRQRRKDLGIAQLRPWDGAVDPHNRPPLEPFKESEIPAFVEKTRVIFDRMSPELAEEFDSLRRRNNLDLDSRKGKQPGGYQCNLEEAREPFIFMNAAGLQRDVETLLHEGGHAFHSLAAKDEPLMYLRSAPMEFCEVASMSMELLGADHLDVFYSEADAARAKRSLIEGIIRILPWIATIDSFQHWLYTHPDHTATERTACWISLLDRFSGEVDWSGHEAVRAASWQKQLHLFHSPFYYIEYGIAQLGALQLWMKSRVDPRQALSNYRAALSLGGTRSLPELFAAAGIQFDFSAKTLLPLMDALREELQSLPA